MRGLKKRLTADLAMQIVIAAYSPLTCVVRKTYNEKCLTIKAIDPITERQMPLYELCGLQFADPSRLKPMLESRRSELERQDFVLSPWQFPSI